MLQIGDKVVYPMHGAGVVEAIEEKEILGVTQKYYILKLPVCDVKIMIPLSSADDIGIRHIIDEDESKRVLAALSQNNQDGDNTNWNRRYRINMDKIKSGDIYEVADVVRSLMIREKQKGLSAGERKMLNSAKQILVSELALANSTGTDEIERLIEERIWQGV
ncbi:CarD family transcriptional regulator [Mahella australiensis]|uniref:Transcriptional regulator, CarD family n=1 Tax=Mahella australiensis (strain DSM 15567 / CIP 107919 / 50-1 BON) TaxID=697281 RepID=F4A2N8_MAHA5|nr:CarD family transcriptional regulator [Mahella australiensis]AEE96218.1 transcriptional regulator, CarD family [Mahella australiensis 50-1 BON]